MRTLRANLPEAGLHEIRMEYGRINGLQRIGGEQQDAPFCWRGFVDIQVNGFSNVDFGADQLDPDSLAAVVQPIFSTGVTKFLPTLVTNEIEVLANQLRVLERARTLHSLFDRAVPGYHLEGPWLSRGASHGAHDSKHMRRPEWSDFERVYEAGGGRILLITIAPELPGAIEFIQRVKARGVQVAIGHMDGTSDDVYRAIEAGATLATHLGNGCPQQLDRHNAPFWAQLADDRLQASIICDGFHLSSELIRIITRMKGFTGCILITDAMQAATMPPGVYKIGATAAELLPSGQVIRLDRASMAGSALTMDRAVANFKKVTGCSLLEALGATTTNPMRLLGCTEAVQGLAPGQPANLILFEQKEDGIRVLETILNGESVWRA